MSNRENVRDEWFALLRDAAACAQPFAQGGAPVPHALSAGKPPPGVSYWSPHVRMHKTSLERTQHSQLPCRLPKWRYPCARPLNLYAWPERAAGDDAAAFGCFAERAPGLLRRLRADNVPAFARLFTAAVMQARPPRQPAAAGELTAAVVLAASKSGVASISDGIFSSREILK